MTERKPIGNSSALTKIEQHIRTCHELASQPVGMPAGGMPAMRLLQDQIRLLATILGDLGTELQELESTLDGIESRIREGESGKWPASMW